MDGEDRLPQRATPSRLPDRWDLSVHPAHAPDALFLLDPEREGFPMWIGPLAAVGLLGRGLAPPAAPRDPVRIRCLDSVRSRV
jgi:hypothetical protein